MSDAITTLSDLWTPDIWINAIEEAKKNFANLMNSGAVMQSDRLSQLASGGGISVNTPVWLDPTDQADGIQVESTAPDRQAASANTQVTPILNRVTANGASALSAGVTGDDPVAYMTSKLAMRRLKQRQTTIVNILNGLFGASGALASLSAGSFDEDEDSQTDEMMISAEMILDATSALGEREDDLEGGAILCHPKIRAALRILDQNDFTRESVGPFIIERWKGIPIYVSNALSRAGTTSGTVYQTYCLAANSFGIGEKPQAGDTIDLASLQYYEDKAKNDWSIYDRTRFLIQPAGIKWVGTPDGQSATNAELAVPANWELAFSSADRCGMVRIQSNG